MSRRARSGARRRRRPSRRRRGGPSRCRSGSGTRRGGRRLRRGRRSRGTAAAALLPLVCRDGVEATDAMAGLERPSGGTCCRDRSTSEPAARARTGTRSAGSACSRGAPGIGWSLWRRPASIRGTLGASRACTGGAGCENSRSALPGLDDHAGVHHVDALAHAGDDAEVVRDDDHRRVRLGARRLRAARGSAPGSSRRALSSVRRRSAASGSHASAIAIITRCRIPPENWCG